MVLSYKNEFMHHAENPEELLQCYDRNGLPTESRLRAEVKLIPYRWWYGVTRVWLVNDDGQLMCSKRSELLSGNPGKWQTYFGGHVGAGQTMRETALREIAEEAGLHLKDADLYLIDKGCDIENNLFFESYAVRFNGSSSDLIFSDGEIVEAKWIGMNEYWNLRSISPDEWCNRCSPENQNKIKQFLQR